MELNVLWGWSGIVVEWNWFDIFVTKLILTHQITKERTLASFHSKSTPKHSAPLVDHHLRWSSSSVGIIFVAHHHRWSSSSTLIIFRRSSSPVTKVVPALTEEVKDALVKNIRRRMNPQPLKFRADIEMKCFQFDGVLHIKDAMRKAEASGNQDCPVKIKLVAPPSYVLITQTLDKFCLIQIQPMKNKLRETTIAFGLLVEAKVIMDRATQRSKWFAFVTFAAIDELSGFGQSYLVKRVDSSPAFVRQRHRATRVQGIRPEFAAILV